MSTSAIAMTALQSPRGSTTIRRRTTTESTSGTQNSAADGTETLTSIPEDSAEGTNVHAGRTAIYESHREFTASPIPILQVPASAVSGSAAINRLEVPYLPAYAPTTYNMPESGVRITLWRLLNTVVLLVFGIVKSIKSFQGNAIVSNSFDLVLGVVWALIATWMFTVESESKTTAPWFFQVNRKRDLFRWSAKFAVAVFFFSWLVWAASPWGAYAYHFYIEKIGIPQDIALSLLSSLIASFSGLNVVLTAIYLQKRFGKTQNSMDNLGIANPVKIVYWDPGWKLMFATIFLPMLSLNIFFVALMHWYE